MKLIPNIKQLCMLGLLVFSGIRLSAQPCTAAPNNITGLGYIILDKDGNGDGDYDISLDGIENVSWTTTGGSLVQGQGDSNGCTLYIDHDNALCQIELTVNYDDASGHHCQTFIVDVVPYMSAPSSCINPGVNYTQPVVNKCTLNPPTPPVVFTYNYYTTPVNCVVGNPFASPCTIQAPLSGSPPQITIGCNVYSSLFPTSPQSMDPVTVNVCLQTPVISGSSCFGCSTCASQTGNLTLTSSAPAGASFYVWTVTGNNCMNVLSSQNGPQTLVLSAYGAGDFYVNVKAYSGNPSTGSFASSGNSVTFHVQSCCASNINVTANVSSPNTDQQQAGVGINASNTIAGGAAAEYHAGGNVTMNPGFSANAGVVYFHAYLEGCAATGGYYRVMNDPGQDTNRALVSPSALPKTPLAGSFPSSSQSGGISVYPNPTSGNLCIQSARPQPVLISLHDLTGAVLLTEKIVTATATMQKSQVDLSNLKAGLYLLKIADEKGHVLKTEKIVVQH